MANFTPREPDLEDGLGKWFNTNDGKRQYLKMKEDQFNDPKFKEKCVDAFNLNFKEGESAEAFKYNDEVFSVNVFNGYGQVYRGAASFPSKEPIKLPAKWGQTNFGSGGGSSKGGGFQKKAYTPPKILIPRAVKNPYKGTLDEVMDYANKNNKIFFLDPIVNEDGFALYLAGDAAIIE